MKKIQAFLLAAALAASPLIATADEISDKEKQIADLDAKIKKLSSQKTEVAGQAEQTQSQVNALKNQLEKAKLELQKTKVTIDKVQEEQQTTSDRIDELNDQVAKGREHLGALIRQLYEREQLSVVRIFFESFSFSEALAQNQILEDLQKQVHQAGQEMQSQIDELSKQQKTLQDRQDSLSQLQAVLSAQKADVAQQEQEQKGVLQGQRAQEAQYAKLLAEAKQARDEISKQVFSLKGSDVQVSLTSANDMARNAERLTGVRAALLLGVLKVESNLGNNVGGGRYPDDMQPQSRPAFVRITDKLGLDRTTTPVSRRPSNGKGWGGAMGPAQIMPATWEAIEPRLEQLLGRSPVNPYQLSDAIVATGIFLADRGASAGKEREALARYLAGPYWEYYVNGWYVDRVLAVTAEYDKELAQ